MATSYERRINLYININGKDVKNDIKSIKGEMQLLINQQAKMTIGSEEYSKKTREIGKLNQILSDHRKSIAEASGATKEHTSATGKLLGVAKGLLPAFGFAAILAGAKAAFSAVVSATDSMGDRWDMVVGGMRAATDYFWTTLSSGDWSDFFTNLAEAARLGSQYAKTLDELGDRQRALSVEEANAQQKILELEEKLRNKQLSREERIKAGEERKKIEQELADIRTKNATIAFNNEVSNNIKFKELGKERTLQLLTDLDSQDRKDAELYNAKKARLESLIAAQTTTQGTGWGAVTVTSSGINSEEIKKLREEMAATPASVQEYAGAIDQFEKITEENRDRVVKTYVDMKNAENSAVENTKRVRTQVNSLLAGEGTDREQASKLAIKITKDEKEEALKILDQAYQERLLKIEQQHILEQDSEANFNLNKAVAERAYLEQKMAFLQLQGDSTIELQRKLNEDELLLMKEMSDRMLQMNAEIWDSFQQSQEAEAEANNAILEKSVQDNIDAGSAAVKEMEMHQKKEQEIIDQKKQAYLDLAGSIGDSLGDVLTNSEASFGDFLKGTLVTALEALEKMMLMNIAEAAMQGLSKGPLGWIAAAAKIIAIKAAFAVAKNAIMGGGKKQKKYSEGGYTEPGGSDEPVGIVHAGEWVAPQSMVKSPLTGPMIRQLEYVRKTGSAKVNVSAIAAGNRRGYQEGGYVEMTSTKGMVQSSTGTADPELKELIRLNTEATNRLLNWKPTIATELIKRDLQILDDIEQSRGL